MKTPQEEAEALLAPIAINSWSKSEVRNAIPLAQLIAVARAEHNDHLDWIDDKSEHCELCDALQALRATGKVEL